MNSDKNLEALAKALKAPHGAVLDPHKGEESWLDAMIRGGIISA